MYLKLSIFVYHQSIHTVEGNKWVQKERWDGKEITYVREIIDDVFVAVSLIQLITYY